MEQIAEFNVALSCHSESWFLASASILALPQRVEDTKKLDGILENIPKKHSVVIKFFCHSFVLFDNWSQVPRVIVPLWPVSYKVDANGQLADGMAAFFLVPIFAPRIS